MSSVKNRKLTALKSWFDKFVAENPGISYNLRELDFDKIAKGMTLAQLQLTLSMTCCAHGVGSDGSRKFWAPKFHQMREAAERATGNKDVSYTALRLVRAE